MKLVPISEIFKIQHGNSLELNRLEQVTPSQSSIAFISRKMNDNGIAAYVKALPNLEPFPAGIITCALSGNGVLSTFIQEKEFYTAYHIACLTPRIKLSKGEILYYCLCIKHNNYKYGFGRQANKTLKDILIPSFESIPSYVKKQDLSLFNRSEDPLIYSTYPLNTCEWKEFKYKEIFHVKKGYYNKKPPVTYINSETPFIGATEKNNGITCWVHYSDLKKYSRDGSINFSEPLENKLFQGNCITVTNNGSVGEAFYQDKPFTCSHDVNPLYLKDITLNIYVAMFLITLIKAEKYRWGYGRKWRPSRMPESTIKLPVDKAGVPDWKFMENYIKSLKFSSQL